MTTMTTSTKKEGHSMRALTFYLLLLLGGCATIATPSETFFPHNPTNDNEASVQFIRPSVVPYAFALEIFIDDEKAAILGNRSTVTFSVPAGNRRILIEWSPGSLGVGRISTQLEFRGGETRHFLIGDRSTILAQTLFDSGRLILTELTRDEVRQLPGEFR
jgi:hypothetical protein